MRRTLRWHSDALFSIIFTPDNQKFVSTSWDKTGVIWNLRTCKKLHRCAYCHNIFHVDKWGANGARVDDDKYGFVKWDMKEMAWRKVFTRLCIDLMALDASLLPHILRRIVHTAYEHPTRQLNYVGVMS